VLGGGIGLLVQRAHVQRDAVAAIQRSGGSVGYSWQWTYGMPLTGEPKPPGPAWLRRMLGPDFLDTVNNVRLQGTQCGDEALKAACRLPWLEELTVVDTAVTDAGAEDLQYLKHLRSLDYRLNRTTPRPLRHLGEMTELRELKVAMRLSPVPLNDEDMAFLGRLTKLESLMLPSVDLTDRWLVFVKDLKNLEVLQLYDMKLTDDGLRSMSGLSKLKVLSLHGTRITSLEHLSSLKKLSYLCVAYTAVDDSDLAVLRDWPNLGELDVRKTEVTDHGVAGLLEANPRLKVTR
jgi:hypothetical protein